jgi:hypothetical protein
VNCRSFFSATIPAIFLFAPVGKAQAGPNTPDARVVLFEANKSKADIDSIAPAPLQKKGRLSGNAILAMNSNKRNFLILSACVYAAGFADMHQTLYARRFSWWYEKDPLARPTVNLPAPAYYATGLALATYLNWISWKMGHSRRWHKLAPVPQLLAIAGNTYGFKSNRYQNP